MYRLRTVTSLDVSAVAGHHAMPAALLFNDKKKNRKKVKIDVRCVMLVCEFVVSVWLGCTIAEAEVDVWVQ